MFKIMQVYLTEACTMTDCIAAQLKLLQPKKLLVIKIFIAELFRICPTVGGGGGGHFGKKGG